MLSARHADAVSAPREQNRQPVREKGVAGVEPAEGAGIGVEVAWANGGTVGEQGARRTVERLAREDRELLVGHVDCGQEPKAAG